MGAGVRVWHEPLPVILPPVLPVEKAAPEVRLAGGGANSRRDRA